MFVAKGKRDPAAPWRSPKWFATQEMVEAVQPLDDFLQARCAKQENAYMDGELFELWFKDVFLGATQEARQKHTILLLMD